MNALVAELMKILDAEMKIYDELAETAQRMNDALRSRDVEGVRSFTLTYDNGFARVESLEERRLSLADMLRDSLGLPSRHPTLQQVADGVGGDSRAQLLRVGAELKRGIARLSKVNMSNRILLEESLSAVAKNLELVMMTRQDAVVYGQRGKMTREPGRMSIVNQTA